MYIYIGKVLTTWESEKMLQEHLNSLPTPEARKSFFTRHRWKCVNLNDNQQVSVDRTLSDHSHTIAMEEMLDIVPLEEEMGAHDAVQIPGGIISFEIDDEVSELSEDEEEKTPKLPGCRTKDPLVMTTRSAGKGGPGVGNSLETGTGE